MSAPLYQYKWKPEPWFDFSHEEYKLSGTEQIFFGQAVQYILSGVSTTVPLQDTDDNNKILTRRYADATSVTKCPGVVIETKFAYGSYADYGGYVNAGGFRRDIQLLREGKVPMEYMGSSTLYFGQPVSPASGGGFVEYAQGQFLLGYLMEELVTSGMIALVKIEPHDMAVPTIAVSELPNIPASKVTLTGITLSNIFSGATTLSGALLAGDTVTATELPTIPSTQVTLAAAFAGNLSGAFTKTLSGLAGYLDIFSGLFDATPGGSAV
jgi:hypothetical protein